MSSLNSLIKEKVNSSGMPLRSLEEKADLRPGAVRNIIYGKSKNPTIGTLKAIAEALDCTVSDLIGEVSPEANLAFQTESEIQEDPIPWDKQLYCKTLEQVGKMIKKTNVTLTKSEITTVIQEVYNYSVGKKRKTVDTNFAKWLISKY